MPADDDAVRVLRVLHDPRRELEQRVVAAPIDFLIPLVVPRVARRNLMRSVEGPQYEATCVGVEFRGASEAELKGVEVCRGLKPWCGRRETPFGK